MPGSRCPDIVAAACFRRPMPPGSPPRATTIAAPSTKRWRWVRRAWCWSSAGCPRTRRSDRRRRTSPARARWCGTASPSCSSTRGRRACRWPSSRCTRCTRPTAPASTRMAHANALCDELGDGLGIAVDVYHVWWDPRSRARNRPGRPARRGPTRRGSWPSTSATGWCRRSDLLLDRGMMGDGVIDIPLIRSWMEARRLPRPARSRDLLGGQLVEARSRRSARHLQGAARQRLLTRSASGSHTPARTGARSRRLPATIGAARRGA